MRLLVYLFFFVFSPLALAEDIATCSNPIGKAYYPELGFLSKKNSGWEENEKVSNGITKLLKVGENKYDIIFVDVRRKVISSVESGGTVLMLNVDKDVVSFLVIYPGSTAEIFTFLKNKSGIFEYIHVSSRAGKNVLMAKSLLMRGDCDFIDFSKL